MFYARRGENWERSLEQQLSRASALLVLANACVLWNTVHLAHAARELRSVGVRFEPEDFLHVSPYAYEHIVPYGQYFFNLEGNGRKATARHVGRKRVYSIRSHFHRTDGVCSMRAGKKALALFAVAVLLGIPSANAEGHRVAKPSRYFGLSWGPIVVPTDFGEGFLRDTVYWQQTRPGNGVVGFGLTPDTNEASSSDSIIDGIDHAVPISIRYEPGTIVYFFVSSTNVDGDVVAQSDVSSFTVGDRGFGFASGPGVTPTSTGAVFTWVNSEPGNGQVNYGLTPEAAIFDGAADDRTGGVPNYGLAHTVIVPADGYPALQPGTTYFYQAISRNLEGDVVALSDVLTFTTLAAPTSTCDLVVTAPETAARNEKEVILTATVTIVEANPGDLGSCTLTGLIVALQPDGSPTPGGSEQFATDIPIGSTNQDVAFDIATTDVFKKAGDGDIVQVTFTLTCVKDGAPTCTATAPPSLVQITGTKEKKEK